MPYWGPVLTTDQVWALVEYLWTFQFDLGLSDCEISEDAASRGDLSGAGSVRERQP